MKQQVYRQIVDLIRQASQLAQTIGIRNLLQPGLVKEMIIADLLGHELIDSKRDADAHAMSDPSEKYEYLSCIEGGSGQLDRMFKEPPEKRAQSLTRITRNTKIYLAVFEKQNQINCKVIYELEPSDVLTEANRQLDQSRNAISHISFSENWAREHGRVVYQISSSHD
ncbi:hypothetical protein RHJ80_10640 [Thermosynechococcus sp. QS41]|uniref:hypothetical protein n=1 Tax=Thermosynechococcus sp. QS41 TaxID=3074101 RepID=UPI002877E5A9|nr:hypothetical protein [Thermosynechococcus sp. QS41]WNC59918.1 hypothetical protein RHJ80_10640 [Thermosynechococcus sp. QS41]